MTHLSLSWLLPAIALFSVATAFALIGLGLLIAVVMRTTRGALFLFVGLVIVVLALELGQAIVSRVVTSENFIELIFLRDMLTVLNGLVSWISPISFFLRGTDAAVRSSWNEWLVYVVGSVLYGLLALVAATELQRRKGVLR